MRYRMCNRVEISFGNQNLTLTLRDLEIIIDLLEFGCRSESFLRLANYENKIYAQCLCHQIKELHLEGCKYLFNNKKFKNIQTKERKQNYEF